MLIEKNNEENKSVTYRKLEQISAELEGDELIDMILKDMPKDYHYISSEKTDKEIWYEEVEKKYE